MKNLIYNILSSLTSYVAPSAPTSRVHIVKSPLSFNNKLVVKAINDILINADKK